MLREFIKLNSIKCLISQHNRKLLIPFKRHFSGYDTEINNWNYCKNIYSDVAWIPLLKNESLLANYFS